MPDLCIYTQSPICPAGSREKIKMLEAERDALKELNSELVHLLEWQQSVENMDDSILCDRAIKIALNKAREVSE